MDDTQLTKEDLMENEYGRECLDLAKFLKVRKLYEDYKDKDWHKDLETLWKNHMNEHWNDWLFKHCFEDGLQ